MVVIPTKNQPLSSPLWRGYNVFQQLLGAMLHPSRGVRSGDQGFTGQGQTHKDHG